MYLYIPNSLKAFYQHSVKYNKNPTTANYETCWGQQNPTERLIINDFVTMLQYLIEYCGIKHGYELSVFCHWQSIAISFHSLLDGMFWHW